MNFSEKYGNDIDEAVSLALRDLKVGRDEVEIIVLEEPSKGFLGIGSKLAKVRVELKQEQSSQQEEVEKIEKPESKAGKENSKPAREASGETLHPDAGRSFRFPCLAAGPHRPVSGCR